jgi:hypothetical protein
MVLYLYLFDNIFFSMTTKMSRQDVDADPAGSGSVILDMEPRIQFRKKYRIHLQGALSLKLVCPDCVGLGQVISCCRVFAELGVHLLERVAAMR